MLHEDLHREPQLRLKSQIRLLARMQLVICMRICIVCIRRAAHIKIVQTDMQTDLDTDTDTDMDMDMGICIYTGLGPSRSVNQQVFQASKVTPYVKSRNREA